MEGEEIQTMRKLKNYARSTKKFNCTQYETYVTFHPTNRPSENMVEQNKWCVENKSSRDIRWS